MRHVFRRYDNLFGQEIVYSTVMTLWALLGQVLRDAKMATCQAAAARIITYRLQAGLARIIHGARCQRAVRLNSRTLSNRTASLPNVAI